MAGTSPYYKSSSVVDALAELLEEESRKILIKEKIKIWKKE